MTPRDFLTRVIDPGLALLASHGGPPASDAARRFLLAIAQQESGPSLTARYQGDPSQTPGPARGWWQFEQGGGVRGVLTHPATRVAAKAVLDYHEVSLNEPAVWRTLEGHDEVAAALARLLIFSDPAPLPMTAETGWAYYQRVWRPGAPRPETWAANWERAGAALTAGPA
jgi:hypothetical protein